MGIPIIAREGDIQQICRQTIDEIAIHHPGRTIVFERSGESVGAWDADRIAQVVANLLSNALCYGDPNSVVTVRSHGEAERVTLEVHNFGPPIRAESLQMIFEPFKREDDRINPERGIGLGLFIVREILAAHRGTVHVRSTEALGTTFVVEMPRVVSSLSTRTST